jgi:hypothetical protein
MNAPDVNMDVGAGASVALSYTADDPDDDAMIAFYADEDGDLQSQGDRILIASGVVDADGALRSLNWDTTGVPEGSYHVVAVIDDGTNTPVVDACPGVVTVWSVWPRDHSNIVLKDQTGTVIPVGSDMPYSPRQTCGTCHDVDEISNGYHFQQGRTDATGTLVMKDDYFNDGRTWLKSAGMYGKW